ncbi:hypothetical protein [Nitrosomonas ureae]|uniref:Uncharacterized protein n=1 Tax=Nitrosomonas ureae TaxID=44577 RepID=A0A286A763_9PROT|nr:hypothetical protein [Nitrosomonas ureae]SOD17760.1 hypothetical protein SAMN06297164_1338 [Nitrosomonas ureae]
MRNNLVNNNKAITLSLVLICVLASVGLIFLEGMNVGIVFFAGYMVIATISSAFKDKRYYSRRVLG